MLTDKTLTRLDAWLRELLWECNLSLPGGPMSSPNLPRPSIHRLKGRILLESGAVKMVQGVRDVFDITDLEKEPENRRKETLDAPKEDNGKLVLIGRGLAGLPWEASLLFSLGLSEG